MQTFAGYYSDDDGSKIDYEDANNLASELLTIRSNVSSDFDSLDTISSSIGSYWTGIAADAYKENLMSFFTNSDLICQVLLNMAFSITTTVLEYQQLDAKFSNVDMTSTYKNLEAILQVQLEANEAELAKLKAAAQDARIQGDSDVKTELDAQISELEDKISQSESEVSCLQNYLSFVDELSSDSYHDSEQLRAWKRYSENNDVSSEIPSLEDYLEGVSWNNTHPELSENESALWDWYTKQDGIDIDTENPSIEQLTEAYEYYKEHPPTRTAAKPKTATTPASATTSNIDSATTVSELPDFDTLHTSDDTLVLGSEGGSVKIVAHSNNSNIEGVELVFDISDSENKDAFLETVVSQYGSVSGVSDIITDGNSVKVVYADGLFDGVNVDEFKSQFNGLNEL